MSCGIDSLYTLMKYNSENIDKRYRLTYLTYFNHGAIFHPDLASGKKYAIKDLYDQIDKLAIEKNRKLTRWQKQ